MVADYNRIQETFTIIIKDPIFNQKFNLFISGN